MQKSHIVILIAGFLVAAGMVMSYYGASLVAAGVERNEGILNGTAPIQVTKELDPAISDTAVFVVQSEGFADASLVAKLFDPSNQIISTKKIEQKSIEEKFVIPAKGTYRLELENEKQTEVHAIIGLTHMPDKMIISLNYLGQMFILSGFVGVVVSGIFALKSRKKAQLR
ncbi:hypothetical protein [Candidatus Nitrosotenuis sp. DW1]|uniref:hypothetical protein n=1 Tax=Candidatus Nitrosotenuis sp. DW1 TaxID=2259672 RepID=UPI0015CD170A|nr:hypothetical protein [Candidatus Nitrosotenuis sp. DW1]QLH08387.1 hypothetical protein DSQ19_01810 [Candidatus Nitrosotenuis sp. DW1]